jgi:Mg-chelatase subunit ChlI
MQRVMELVARVAPTDANVLVLGENGTGKGVIAQQLHAQSLRAARTLVKVNMGAIAESVFESEMFGHVRGAYTDAKSERIGRFELADGGTLFLDEVGNVPPSQQPKLLRVLEDGEFERLGSSRTQTTDVRLVSATNADLAIEVEAGRFRKDLLYRLNTLEIRLPPLPARALPERDLVANDAQCPRVVPRLLDEIAGPAMQRIHHQRHVAPRRHHDDRQVRHVLAQLVQQRQPLFARRGVAGVVEVDQRATEIALARGVQRRGRAARTDAGDTLGFQQQAQGLAHVGLVVGKQHGGIRFARHVVPFTGYSACLGQAYRLQPCRAEVQLGEQLPP